MADPASALHVQHISGLLGLEHVQPIKKLTSQIGKFSDIRKSPAAYFQPKAPSFDSSCAI
jgi:hypothetical protein